METNLSNDFAQSLMAQLDEIKRATILGSKDVLNISECSMLTGFSTKTLYKYTSKRIIPYSKHGKNVFFSKKQIENWLMSFSIPTEKELGSLATTYVATHKLPKK